jgi:hypothetical protein
MMCSESSTAMQVLERHVAAALDEIDETEGGQKAELDEEGK